MNPRFSSTLGLCMRAGRLRYGFDTVRAGVQSGEIFLVLTASDVSPRTTRETSFFSDKQHVPCYPISLTMKDVRSAAGKLTGVLGIADEGFAKMLLRMLSENTPGESE